MYCYQCEETIGPCDRAGVCGKTNETANMQDQLIYLAKKIAKEGNNIEEENRFIINSLFVTITNVNFNAEDIKKRIDEGLNFIDITKDEIESNAGIKEENQDIKSLKETLTYGVKGIAAYMYHADALSYNNDVITGFVREALAATLEDKSVEELTNLVLKCGEFGVKTMELLDQAHTETYGHPEPTTVSTGAGSNPGILVSGHDLHDLKQLLEQTKGTGVDVYTHGEMLPANYYPGLKYEHLVGNYGGSWWKQKEEFENFNGAILMTTNCLVPPGESYKDRLYTTGVVSYDGVKHIEDNNGSKDFSDLIQHAKQLSAPTQIENGYIKGGFARASVSGMADKVVEAVKQGSIRKFVVMAGCDGRRKQRQYYEDFAEQLPKDTVILTAGCAKYRYNKLDLGEIGGIPRVLDTGQCNDSYSIVMIAKKLQEAFGLEDINELPVSYNIAWYEQKAVLVLLSLLHLGVKNIHLGPRLPAFVSENVLNLLQEKFGIGTISDVDSDIKALG